MRFTGLSVADFGLFVCAANRVFWKKEIVTNRVCERWMWDISISSIDFGELVVSCMIWEMAGNSREYAGRSLGFMRSSYKGRMGDVLVSEGDEGRGSLRKARGS